MFSSTRTLGYRERRYPCDWLEINHHQDSMQIDVRSRVVERRRLHDQGMLVSQMIYEVEHGVCSAEQSIQKRVVGGFAPMLDLPWPRWWVERPGKTGPRWWEGWPGRNFGHCLNLKPLQTGIWANQHIPLEEHIEGDANRRSQKQSRSGPDLRVNQTCAITT